MGTIEALLRWYIPFKEIGWEEIQEEFTRFTILKTRWFSIYIHKLDAPIARPADTLCHDHPWSFWAILLSGGYYEHNSRLGYEIWRSPGDILYRPAKTSHATRTKWKRPNWSIILVSRKVREWNFNDCR